MTTKNLDKIFEPENVAVIGATEKEGIGLTLFENLVEREKGKTIPINPNRNEVLGFEAFPSVKEVPEQLDLGIVATPACTVPQVVEECGRAGLPALIVISSGFSETSSEGAKLEEEINEIRQDYGMRILGPNCLGIINPKENLNASFMGKMPAPGNEVFISQSGALASSILDWAITAQFGFHSFISIGNMVDIDFGDLIDYFGRDPETGSILMYIESIEDVRKFMSSARSFARTKPILAVKSRKSWEDKQAGVQIIDSLFESHEVYESSFKRVGITNVDSMEDLFTCSEVLAKHKPPAGPSLAIVTNAGGPGAMASETVTEKGGELASLSEETFQSLKEILPSRATYGNPVYITGDARPEQYKKSVEACLKDENVDGILCIYAPVGTMSPEDVAESITELKEITKKPILTSWMGGERVEKAKEILREGGFSVQFSPEQSVKNFIYLNEYARSLERLLETPEEMSIDNAPPKYHLKAMIEKIAREGRENLTELESKKILRTYNIRSTETLLARSGDEAMEHASEMGFPVELKINSHNVFHKTEAGEVALNLFSQSDVKEAYEKIIDNFKENHPDSKIEGVAVQKMVSDAEPTLFLGMERDPLFGSILIFGKGGRYMKHYKDIALGLPPLNQTLARRLMEETKVYDILKESKNSSQLLNKLEENLIKLSQLVIDFPEIKRVVINPLACTGDDLLALDAKLAIDKDLALGDSESDKHLVIEPYPKRYVEEWEMNNRKPVTLRPVRPEDEPLAFELWDTFSEETFRYRFFSPIREITHEDMARFTNVDYRREIAIVAELEENDDRKMIGISRLVIDPSGDSGELAVVIGDPWQGEGLGKKMVDTIIGVARDMDLKKVEANVLKDNYRMINLCKKLGFEADRRVEDSTKLVLELGK